MVNIRKMNVWRKNQTALNLLPVLPVRRKVMPEKQHCLSSFPALTGLLPGAWPVQK